MGGIHSVRSASTVGLAAVLMLGCVPAALAESGLDHVKAHIDIPEIGRGGKLVHSAQNDLDGLLDENDSGVQVPVLNPYVPPEMNFPPSAGQTGLGASEALSSFIRGDLGFDRDPSAFVPTGTTGIPGPAVVAPFAVLALGALRRRRRD